MKIIKEYGLYLLPALVLAMPVLASAQTGTIQSSVTTIGGIVGALVPILIGIAMLAFIWGVIQYMVAKDDAAQKEARGVMLYGVLALFVIVAIWGLVGFIGKTFGIDTDAKQNAPVIPGLSS
jgi:hypothetical protein